MLRTIKFQREMLRADLIAGLTGAVAGAPQAMGFAIIAGVSPLYGLYAAFITTIASSIFSSSALLVYAPTNALALIAASALITYPDALTLDVLVMLSVLTGIFLLLVGVLRLGSLTRFVSSAVMTGFITGAGALIILGQLDHLTGYDTERSSIPLQRFWDWFSHLARTDTQTVIVGVLAILMIFAMHHSRLRSYATLITIVVLTTIKLVLGWESVEVVRDMSAIPRGLPLPFMPDFMLAPELLATAFAMAILASIQSAALIEATPNPGNRRSDVSKDFVAMGIGNIVGGFFRGLPSCASLSRTAVNISSGAKTQQSNIFSGLFIGLTLVLFGNLIEEIPLAVLAGHLVVAAVSLIKPHDLWVAWRVNWSSRIAMIATLVSTLLLPLQFSIYIGVGLSLLLYVYTSALDLPVVQLIPIGNGRFRRDQIPQELPPDDILILSVYGNLYFAAVRRLEDLLPPPESCHNSVIILRIRENQYFGDTGIRMLSRYAERLRECGGRFILSGIEPTIYKEIYRTGAIEQFGEDNIFTPSDIIFDSTLQAYEDAQKWVSQHKQSGTPAKV